SQGSVRSNSAAAATSDGPLAAYDTALAGCDFPAKWIVCVSTVKSFRFAYAISTQASAAAVVVDGTQALRRISRETRAALGNCRAPAQDEQEASQSAVPARSLRHEKRSPV